MQNHTFSGNNGDHSLYAGGVPQQQSAGNAAAASYPIDPSLNDNWTPQQADSNQYAAHPEANQYASQQSASNQYGHQSYSVDPQYYGGAPYIQSEQQQQQQQPMYHQGFTSMSPFAVNPQSSRAHPSFQQQPAAHFTDDFHPGFPSQHNFTSGFNFSAAQPSQQQTISPHALQVGDNQAQAQFHQRELNQQQRVYDQTSPQAGWSHKQSSLPPSAQFSHLQNRQAQAPPKQASNIHPDQQQSGRYFGAPYLQNSLGDGARLATSNFSVIVPGTGQGVRNNGNFQSMAGGSGQSTIPQANNHNAQAAASDPLRITNQALLDRYPSMDDSSHRVKRLPFVVLEDKSVKVDIRGTGTTATPLPTPDYQPRPNSFGARLKPSSGQFASTVKRGRGRPRKDPNAPVKPKIKSVAKPRPTASSVYPKQGSPSTPSLETTPEEYRESASEEEYEYEEHQEIEMKYLKDIRAAVRPADDPAAAAKYDAITIVLKEGPVNGAITRDEVIKAVQAFEPFIIKLRDNYRTSVASLQEATTKKQKDQILKSQQAKQVNYQALIDALNATLQHGHRDIIQNLGTNHKIVVVLWTLLTDFAKADDFTSEIWLIALELMSKFSDLTPDLLKRLSFEKIQKRVAKKGNEKMKEFLVKISNNAGEEGKRDNESSSEKAKESASASALRAGVKRAHDGEDANTNPPKKLAVGPTNTSSVKTTTTITTKVAPRPTSNVFASLTRPAKAPVSNGTKTPAKSTPAKPVAKQAPPMTSRFGDIMASINAVPEVPKAPVVPEGPPETPEEKKKRERKESRRHLRVTWKEGDDLVQVKLFTQVEGEDDSRKAELTRDAHDDRSEGMMLKHRQEAEIDEDEATGEIEFRPYPELIPVDFSVIDEKTRAETYTTRGGLKTFSTPQQRIQSLHESTELMVVYTDPADIPSSAKEPPEEEVSPSEVKILIPPSETWVRERQEDIRVLGAKQAAQNSVARLNHTTYNKIITTAYSQQKNHKDFQRVYDKMDPKEKADYETRVTTMTPKEKSDHQARVVELDRLLTNIATICAPIMNKPYPPTEPPEHMNERQKAEWWEGYNKDKELEAAKQAAQQPVTAQQAPQAPIPKYDNNNDILTALALSCAQSRTAAQAQPIQQAVAPQQAFVPPAPHLISPEWQAYYQHANAMNQASQQHAANTMNQASQQQANTYAWPGAMPYMPTGFPTLQATTAPMQATTTPWNDGSGDNGYASQAGQSNDWMQSHNWTGNGSGKDKEGGGNTKSWNRKEKSGNHGNYGKYRDRDGGKDREEGFSRRDRDRDGESSGGRKSKNYKVGTKPCRFFQEGKCAKGDSCTYRHDS